ncbi:hypothetical protein PGN35_012300 [Nodosilinea sp. PGN35]|uniref:hypothetical protein n=1 Tax=Nodosilinea sp. PGN35 TaxID=3020489 RepID=UPI0023B28D1B|nr:hypothetical protein [Nodosilinea sp. TSF1-S3]MDF0368660.1 hypothetical protein [Nodosilinea sp. TSF1-S3]
MTDYPPGDRRDSLPQDLNQLSHLIDQAALDRKGSSTELLALLRLLERCHRDICETLFYDALPDNRQHLYALLRDIEINGGWPYIQRMKLQALLANLPDLDFEVLFPPRVLPLEDDQFPGEGK